MYPVVRKALTFLAPLALALQSGCSGCGGAVAGSDNGDVFGGLDVATEGQMDSQAMSYLWARPTSAVILCIKAPCPSYEVRAVDGKETKLVHQFDLRALGLPELERKALMNKMGQTLTRGRYAKARFQGQDIVVFQVTRALSPIASGTGEKPTTDSYYHVTVAGGCDNDSCLKWSAKPLKGGAATVWDQLDLRGLELDEGKTRALYLELRSRGAYLSAQGTPTGVPLITQAFHAQ